ncbi:coiled-coil domain-containing protein 187 isoform X1 [Solea solea]|uniref:coiled-coil domain-containing protein 187 isoform X1 n=1 Tax=Solea solea TaxID=90069 RepID=UPI00272A4F47|nr:coiled-coil domain-containing protein 187 isoform X1 [Solea solea]
MSLDDISNASRCRTYGHHCTVDCKLNASVFAMNLTASRLFPIIHDTTHSASPAMCQCFAVLEDGVLAHNLQEQEIEQHYTSNVQKNQLVQNDIRVAKRLQDEEEEQWAQQTAVVRQTSRQLEEQDLEFARVIQDEIQRCAEEARRREMDDEEIAKRLQEEEQRINGRSRGQKGDSSEGSGDDSALPPPQQLTLRSLQEGEQGSTFTTRWQSSTSQNHSDSNGTSADSHRGQVAHRSTASWSNQGHAHSIRQIRHEFREPLSEDSEDSDTVFSEQLSVWSQRWDRRVNTAPPQRQASLHHSQGRSYRSLSSHNSLPNAFRSWRDESGECEEDYYDNDHYAKEIRRLANRKQERSSREGCDGWNRSRDQDRDSRLVKGRERRCSRSESVRIHDRVRHKNRDLVRTCSYKDNPDKRVHFQDDTGRSNRQSDESKQVWEMLGQILEERGVPVTLGGNGAPLQIRSQRRDSQSLHGSEVSYSNSQPHQRAFQRAATTRHSFHGDIRKRRESSYRENSGRDHREGRDRHCDNVERDGELYEISSRDSSVVNRERQGSRRWRNDGCTNGDEVERNAHHHRVKGTTSECGHWHKPIEQRLSSVEAQNVERRVEWPPRRAPQRSQSLSSNRSSTRGRPRHMSAGVSLQLDPGEASLDLGELQQVLQDEELARKLQEEEEKLLRRTSQPSPRSSYPEGDFRVAQVAQDEEIAHFMQKQEIKSKRRSRELEGPSSWREHRAMITHHDRQAARERQVQRERLDSEGLPSHTEDCSPENQPPSPTSTLPQDEHIRNIAEELDPTFQSRRQDTERLQLEQTGPACQSPPMPRSGSNDIVVEPAFIPPTKRQTEKPGSTKPKGKRENCKQQ